MAFGTSLAARGRDHSETVYRFAAGTYDIVMSVEYFDAYSANGFWFTDRTSNRHFCLSESGQENHDCWRNFFGSIAIARYHVQSCCNRIRSLELREHVRTIDQDSRLRFRAPFDYSIQFERGIASDIQAFGYRVDGSAGSREPAPGPNGPWCYLRQDLYLDPNGSPFLVVHWKHTLPAIRLLDAIPVGKTRLLSDLDSFKGR